MRLSSNHHLLSQDEDTEKKARACWRLPSPFSWLAADFVLLQPALVRAKLGLQLALGHVCRRTVTPSQHSSRTNRRAPARKVKLTISRVARTTRSPPLQCSKLYAGTRIPPVHMRRDLFGLDCSLIPVYVMSISFS